MSAPSSGRDPVEKLAEEFAERFRRGERPSLTEYTQKYPELAEQIRDLFPALAVIEQFGSVAGPPTGPFAPQVAKNSPIPLRLGDYRLLREVGRGGMGIVYEAVQESLARHVALKVLPFHRLMDPTHLERFRREARAAAQLHHTNIVPVFGVGEHEGINYYAMQFIQGQGLDEILREVKRLRVRKGVSGDAEDHLAPAITVDIVQGLLTGHFQSPEGKVDPALAQGPVVAPSPDALLVADAPTVTVSEAIRASAGTRSEMAGQSETQYFRSVAQVGVQVADALAYAHKQGILHRDIKPSNLLLDGRGTVWITDFGLAKAEGSDELTTPGDIVGTLRYMAPERFQGKADPRSDVYSTGTTLYELLTLKPVFADSDRARLMERVVHEEPPRPRQLEPHLPRDLETIVLRALAKDPSDRYSTAEALAEDLRRFLADRPIRARRSSAAERTWRWCRRNPVIATATGLAAMALAAVAGLSIALAVQQYHSAEQMRREQHQTELALDEARGQRTLAERLSTNLALDRALSLCEHGDVALGMLWLSRALEIAKDPELARVIRANLSGWKQELPPLKGLLQQQDAVQAVAWSPDGKTVLTGGWDCCGRLWSADTGNPVGPPLRDGAMVRAVAFSPDGRRALTASDRSVQVWEVATGTPLGRPIKCSAEAASFSPDGKVVVTGGVQGKVRRWDAGTGEFLGELLTHGRMVWALAFSPDGRSLVTAGDDGMARLWDAATGHPRGQTFPHQGSVYAVAFSPDGSRLVTGGEDGAARVWDTATGKPLGLPLLHRGKVYAASFSRDGQTVLTGSIDGTARLWDAATGKPLGLPLLHRGYVRAAALSPDGKTALTGGPENVARLWDVSRARRTPPCFRHTCNVRAVAFSPNGDHLLTAGEEDRTVRVWNARTGEEVGEPLPHHDLVRAVAWSPDESTLLTGCFDGTARLWEAGTRKPLLPPIAHAGGVWAVAFSPDGKSFLTGDDRGTVQGWETATAKPLGPAVHLPARSNALAWSPDARAIAAACQDGKARLWDSATGKALAAPLQHEAAVWAVAFGPGGRTILTGSWDGTARLWDSATGEPTGRTFSHQAKVEAAAFSPDGRTILTGSFDGVSRLWDIATGKPIGPPLVQGHLVEAVAFRPDGKAVATAGADLTARLWEVPLPAEGPVEDLVRECQLLTGMQLDGEGTATVLQADAWYRSRGAGNSRGTHSSSAWDLPPFPPRSEGEIAGPRRVEVLDAGGLKSAPQDAWGLLEAEDLPITGSKDVWWSNNDMSPYGRDRWSNGRQLFCATPKGGFVELEVTVPDTATYQLDIYFTKAPDHGNVEVAMDGQPIGKIFDGFNGEVVPSGKVDFGRVELHQGPHRLRFTAVDKNALSTKYFIGIDCLSFRPVK